MIERRPPRAMVLAAGLGTRLGELSRRRPKPMLPVCGTPLVRWAVLWLRAQGVRELVVNLHHLGERIEHELGDGRELGVAIAYSREEPEILGTGGALRQARSLIDDGRDGTIVVVNAKILVELELARVLDRHVQSGAEATMVLRPDAEAARWGALAVDRDDNVVRLLDTVREGAVPGEPLMFTGIAALQPRFLDRIPAEGPQCVVRTAYRSLFESGRGLSGFVTRGYWWEHSTPERYLAGVRNVLDGRVDLPFAEHPLIGIHREARVEAGARLVAPFWIGPGVRIGAGATVGPHVQLGADVDVAAGARVARTIAWESTRLSGVVEDRIVTGEDDVSA